MQFTKILLSIVFLLVASTALAAKPKKTLVCHVGSELGSMDETYQDNPDCTIPPEWVGDPADYICPDAGKVDLILVSKKAKHLGNPAHSFEDDTAYLWEDYAPEDGVGDDPADFEEGDVPGIDRGCELAEEKLLCECWNDYTQAELIALYDAAVLPGLGSPSCFTNASTAYATYDDIAPEFTLQAYTGEPGVCEMRTLNSDEYSFVWDPNGGSDVCLTELTAIVPAISWCQPD